MTIGVNTVKDFHNHSHQHVTISVTSKPLCSVHELNVQS